MNLLKNKNKRHRILILQGIGIYIFFFILSHGSWPIDWWYIIFILNIHTSYAMFYIIDIF